MNTLNFKYLCCAVLSVDIYDALIEQQERWVRTQHVSRVAKRPASFKALRVYTQLCMASFTRQLEKCRTAGDYKRLYEALNERLALSSNEFLNAAVS